jgi:hypothetical protein
MQGRLTMGTPPACRDLLQQRGAPRRRRPHPPDRRRCLHRGDRSPAAPPLTVEPMPPWIPAWSVTTAAPRLGAYLAPSFLSPPRRATRLPPSSLSTTLERRLLATAVPHKAGRGCWRCHVLGVSDVCVQVFHLNVAYVAMAIYACIKHMFNVAKICFRCFKCMFH